MTNKPMLSVERELLAVVEGLITSQADAFPLINVPRGLRSEGLDQVSKELRALLDKQAECRCKRYGKDNPHWPCPVHAEPAAQHQGEPVGEVVHVSEDRIQIGLYDEYSLEVGDLVYAEQPAVVCETCHDQGEVFVSKGKAEHGMETEPEPIYRACPDCGEPAPVAYRYVHDYEHGNGWQRNAVGFEQAKFVDDERKETWREITQLYAVPQPTGPFSSDTVVCRRYTLEQSPGQNFYHYDAEPVYGSVPVTISELIDMAETKPVAVVQSCKIGIYGRAYDLPGTKRAYTYKDQPDNVGAMKLGRAASAAKAGGDSIDHGLSLLKSLSDEGFGVFEVARLNGEKP